MALISTFDSITKDRQTVHKPTRCLYSIFKDKSGRPYLQLDTYGSDDRLNTEKISQSIQIDEAAASKLRKLLDEAFPQSP